MSRLLGWGAPYLLNHPKHSHRNTQQYTVQQNQFVGITHIGYLLLFLFIAPNIYNHIGDDDITPGILRQLFCLIIGGRSWQ